MDRLRSLEIFIAVARLGGFAPAARKLGLSAASATRGVAELEQRLGTVLFHRTTRSVRLTQEGSDFLPHAERILADLDEAERKILGHQQDPRGTVFITAPVAFGRLHVLPVVGDMLERHAALDARLMLVDRNIRFVEEGIDVAVRIGTLEDTGLHAVHIADVRPIMVASPSYIARFGYPGSAAELASHRLISTDGPRASSQWQPLGNPAAATPRLQLNTIDSILAAAEAGTGIAGLLSYQADDSIRQGRLVEIPPVQECAWWPVNLLFSQARGRSPAVRLFIDMMRERTRCEVGFADRA